MTSPRSTQIGFVFGGQGPEWWGMGRELYGTEPVFTARVQECDEALRRVSGMSILDQFSVAEVKSQIRRVDIAQAMLLAVHLGLAALWEEWGVVPSVVAGHAAGELSAACYAGALTVEEAMRVIVARAAVMRRLAGAGLMVAVRTDATTGAELIRGLEDRVAVGVVNGPNSIVLSGDGDAMVGLAHQLASRGMQHRVLRLPYAVYAPRMAAAAPELGRTLRDLAPVSSRIPIVSTVTGDVIDGAQLDAAHWARNIADPVRFADAVATFFARGVRMFVEIGPHPTLGNAIAECAAAEDGRVVTVLPSLLRQKPERKTMRASLAALNAADEKPAEQPPAPRAPEPAPATDAAREPSVGRVVAIHPPSPFPTTFFVGGAAIADELYLRDVATALGPSHRSFALLAPGLADGEEPIADIGRLAAMFADQVAAHAPDQPIALVGHSVGGAVAFEIARLLERRRCRVTALVLVDAPLYSAAADASEVWDTPSLGEYLARAKAAGWITPEIERGLPRRDQSPDAWARHERTWSASVDALRAYRPGEGSEFHGPTTFITPARPQDGLVECAARWRVLCPTLEVITTAGNHLTMVRAPNAGRIAQLIRGLVDADGNTVG